MLRNKFINIISISIIQLLTNFIPADNVNNFGCVRYRKGNLLYEHITIK